MLFNSYYFIGLFLPLVIITFYLASRWYGPRTAVACLVLFSLFFYGWWNPVYLTLIIGSILFNYNFGRLIVARKNYGKALLVVGVAANLSTLAYFKYANFFVDNLNWLGGTDIALAPIVLPLAISFFTFQQITYLVDASRGETAEYDFSQYCLFVTFFPQLIAGPIVHHKEMMPQFSQVSTYKFQYANLALGCTVFIFGLFKKVVIADNVAPYSTRLFDATSAGFEPSLIEAWGGALAYTFQLYFDFSGYSDMAIGLALMFGIRLPLNFNSPYKAHNIIEFWRRWHITLSRFLRDYLYIPLGGNRHGQFRRYLNLFLTMLLGGLWHGAGWTFICWGALHGAYLAINHAWHAFRRLTGMNQVADHFLGTWVARILTFIAVVVGWVFFRAESFDSAFSILSGMIGFNGVVLPGYIYTDGTGLTGILQSMGVQFGRLEYFEGMKQLLQLGVLLAVVWWAPSSIELVAKHKPICDMERHHISPSEKQLFSWAPTGLWAVVVTVMFVVSIIHMTRISEFLYFQF